MVDKRNNNKKFGINRRNNSRENPVKDDKLKPLSPTLRTKKRYFLVYIESSHRFNFKELSGYIQDELVGYLGSLFLGESGFWLLPDKFDHKNQYFVCRVSLNSKERVLGALSLISKLGEYDVALRTVYISGTLKGIEKKKDELIK